MENRRPHFQPGVVEDVVVEEKQAAHHGDYSKEDQHGLDVGFIESFPEKKRKAIVRKIDFRLPPFLALLYCESLLLALSIVNYPNMSEQ